MLKTAGNPRIPTLEEAMDETLTLAEREAFVAHLRPLVEARHEIVWQIAHGDTPDNVRNHPDLKGLNIPRMGGPGMWARS